MKKIRLYFVGLIGCCLVGLLSAQTENPANSVSYKVEAFGSMGSGDYTPFWITSNRYGVVPLDAGNGYLRPGVFLHQSFGKGFHWEAGIDMVVSAPRYRNVYIQQLYAEIGFQAVLLSIGSKERYTSLWDRNLSSGDMVLSANARPIPEMGLSMPAYTNVPLLGGWLQVKGDFTVGRSFDKAYLKDFSNGKQTYNDDILWHHKSGAIRIKDTRGHFPLSFEIGVQHRAQWGGTSTDPAIGKQPQSFKDFLRIVAGKEGGEGATIADTENTLGNHFGAYNFRIGFTKETWAVQTYYQHYFEDKSGIRFNNRLDGLWGMQLDLHKFPWLKKVVLEYMDTRHQSGPLHYIWFDHDKYPGFGGGADDYYNNGEYKTGSSYFSRALGSPLIQSPEYNTDGSLDFKNNRIRAWHFGFEGNISSGIDYRLLVTNINSWGISYRPFLNRKNSVLGMAEISYCHPKLAGWTFKGSVAADTGDYTDKGFGFGISVTKRGVLSELLP